MPLRDPLKADARWTICGRVSEATACQRFRDIRFLLERQQTTSKGRILSGQKETLKSSLLGCDTSCASYARRGQPVAEKGQKCSPAWHQPQVFQARSHQGHPGKILVVLRNNNLCRTPNSRGQNMPVIFIWQRQTCNQGLVPSDKALVKFATNDLFLLPDAFFKVRF